MNIDRDSENNNTENVDLSHYGQKLDIQKKVSLEQYKILHKNLPISLTGNFICSAIVFIALYNVIPKIFLWGWFGAVILITVARLISYFRFQQYPQYDKFYLNIFLLLLALSAATWGVIDSILMPQSDLLRQMVVIVIVAGVTAGGIQTLQANLTACFIFVIGIITPLTIWLFFQNDIAYFVLGIVMSTYLLFMLSASFRNNQILLKALTLNFENLELIKDLSFSNEQLKQREHDLTLIKKMNDLLQTCADSDEAYTIINQSAQHLFAKWSGGLSIFDQPKDHLETVKQWGEQHILLNSFSPQDCWALRQGQAYLVTDAHKNVICRHFQSIPESSICLPLIVKNSVIGMLNLNKIDHSMISDYQLKLANTFNEVTKLSLANIQLLEKLHEQNIHDPLTQIFNRRYLNETLPRELKRAIRENNVFSVALFDLDYFKQFNDQYGHEAGDEVLKFIGTKFKDHFRGSDIACRFGGEEFIVVLLNTDLNAAVSRLELVRKEIKQAQLYFHNKPLRKITVSIGIAEAPTHGKTMDEVIRAADEALYRAKEEGRDRIETYKQELVV